MRFNKIVENSIGSVRLGAIFLLCSFFLMNFISADDEVEVEFNVDGCTFEFRDAFVNLGRGECSGGSLSDGTFDPDAIGRFFCGNDFSEYITTNENLGCSRELSSLGNDPCCPRGMFCNETAEAFRCEGRPTNCFAMNDESACDDNDRCYWMNVTNECVDNPRMEYDCSYYKDEDSCDGDEWELGQFGIGTELCGTPVQCGGTTLTVSEEGCECVWFPTANRCQFQMNATNAISTDEPVAFSCSSVFELGDCEDGEQNVTWNSTNTTTFGIIPGGCLDALGCNGGESRRFCGEPIIKLPGISLFALFISLFVIGFYYFVVRKV